MTSSTLAPAIPFTAIDCHAHVMRTDVALAANRHSAPERDVTPEEYLALLDAHGVSHGVLTAPSFYGTNNSVLQEALEAYPTRLRGTGIVAPDIDRAALLAMDRAGFTGIRLNWTKRNDLPDLSTPDYQKLFVILRDLNWHVEVFLEAEKLPGVLPHISRSGVTIVFDHFGHPEPVGGVNGEGFRLLLAELEKGRAWTKLSAPYRLRGAPPQPYVDALRAAGGLEHLVWASDWPWVQIGDDLSYQKCLDWLGDWIPDAGERRQVLVNNARTLFRF